MRRELTVAAMVTFVLLSALFFLLNGPAPEPADSSVPPPLKSAPVARVRLDESEAWVQHLRDKGVVRLLVPDEQSQSGSVRMAKDVEGLGRLSTEGYAFARTSLESMIQQRNKALIDHYNRPVESWPSEEAQRLEEAKLISFSRSSEACVKALNAGSYFIVKSQAGKPPLPEGVDFFNVPLVHDNAMALLVVVVKESQYALDAADENVSKWRYAWMSKLAYDFNAKPAEVRQELLQRFARNNPEDAAWRNSLFPRGMQIDADRHLVFSPH